MRQREGAGKEEQWAKASCRLHERLHRSQWWAQTAQSHPSTLPPWPQEDVHKRKRKAGTRWESQWRGSWQSRSLQPDEWCEWYCLQTHDNLQSDNKMEQPHWIQDSTDRERTRNTNTLVSSVRPRQRQHNHKEQEGKKHGELREVLHKQRDRPEGRFVNCAVDLLRSKTNGVSQERQDGTKMRMVNAIVRELFVEWSIAHSLPFFGN